MHTVQPISNTVVAHLDRELEQYTMTSAKHSSHAQSQLVERGVVLRADFVKRSNRVPVILSVRASEQIILTLLHKAPATEGQQCHDLIGPLLTIKSFGHSTDKIYDVVSVWF